MGTKRGGTMNLRLQTLSIKTWSFETWGCALACVALIATGLTMMPHDSAEVALSATIIEARADAAAGVTFKIVSADAASTKLSWTPLTGDGSN